MPDSPHQASKTRCGRCDGLACAGGNVCGVFFVFLLRKDVEGGDQLFVGNDVRRKKEAGATDGDTMHNGGSEKILDHRDPAKAPLSRSAALLLA